MTKNMGRRLPLAALLAVLSLGISPIHSSAQAAPASSRKIVNRVMPQYPSMARSLNIRGNVRVEALVEPNGTVKTVEVKGGHPLLVQAAETAIREWKFAPATHETKETIEVRFDPQ